MSEAPFAFSLSPAHIYTHSQIQFISALSFQSHTIKHHLPTRSVPRTQALTLADTLQPLDAGKMLCHLRITYSSHLNTQLLMSVSWLKAKSDVYYFTPSIPIKCPAHTRQSTCLLLSLCSSHLLFRGFHRMCKECTWSESTRVLTYVLCASVAKREQVCTAVQKAGTHLQTSVCRYRLVCGGERASRSVNMIANDKMSTWVC